jgi:diaminopimelate epimerase
VKIVKLSGAGNDFVALGPDQARLLGGDLADWVRRVCRRGLSVGADGLLVVTPSGAGRVRVRFFNPDGGEAFCGNGSRCAARFAQMRGWVATSDSFVLETAVGEIEARVLGRAVRLVLPPPRDSGAVAITVDGADLTGHFIDAGVPLFVVQVEDVEAAPLALWGPLARRHPQFGPAGTNVDVISIHGQHIRVRTWERGVEGETLSCGTGAVAAAHAARMLAGLEECVRVTPASGVDLTVTLSGRPERPEAALLEGDARVIFEGTVPDEGTEGFPS